MPNDSRHPYLSPSITFVLICVNLGKLLVFFCQNSDVDFGFSAFLVMFLGTAWVIFRCNEMVKYVVVFPYPEPGLC